MNNVDNDFSYTQFNFAFPKNIFIHNPRSHINTPQEHTSKQKQNIMHAPIVAQQTFSYLLIVLIHKMFFFFLHSTEFPYDGSAMVRNERKLSSQMHNIMRERREASLAIDNMLSMTQNEGKLLTSLPPIFCLFD